MAVKNSDIAKEQIIAALQEKYPDSAVVDKKLYINIPVSGEMVQIAITLTAPKNKIEFGQNALDMEVAPKAVIDEAAGMKEVEKIFDFFNIK
jgi:hypothetical protein